LFVVIAPKAMEKSSKWVRDLRAKTKVEGGGLSMQVIFQQTVFNDSLSFSLLCDFLLFSFLLVFVVCRQRSELAVSPPGGW
jgi:hypothetical protein